MRLAELEPAFVTYDGDKISRIEGVSFDEAQGLWFLCPACFAKNGGNVGTHFVETTFRDRGTLPSQGSHNAKGEPTRWAVAGLNFGNLTLTPSVQIVGGCAWHGHVTSGAITK